MSGRSVVKAMGSGHRRMTWVAVAAVLLAAIPTSADARQAPFQDPPPEEWDSVTDVIRGHEWADGINNLLDVVAAMPDSAYAYRPTPEMATFGDIVGHIADVQYGFCDGIARREGPDRAAFEARADKSATIRYLRGSIDVCDQVFDRMTDEQLVAERGRVADRITTMMGHTRRETGKLVTYLRLVGVTPPEVQYFQGRKWRGR